MEGWEGAGNARERAPTPEEEVTERLYRASKSRSNASIWKTGVERVIFPRECPLGLIKLRMIRNEELTAINDELGQFSNMRSLNISSSPRIQSLPASLGALRALKFLCVSACSLQALPESITRLACLEILDCSTNQLSELPSAMHHLSRLQSLNCANNPMEQMMPDASIQRMTALISVNFSECNVRQVPRSLFLLPQLRRVVLEGNRDLESLPETVEVFWRKSSTHRSVHRLWNGTALRALPNLGRVESLDCFAICGMRAVEMPRALAHMHFSRLSVQDCSLSNMANCSLPSTIVEASLVNTSLAEVSSLDPLLSSCDTLRSLCLDFNNLPSIPASFLAFSALTSLSLTTNPALTSFSSEAAAGLSSLLTLRANNCSLVDMTPICLISSLRSLVLRDNAIERVPKDVSRLVELHSFDLSNNQIWYFDSGLTALTNLVRLSLTNNPATEDLLGDPSGVLTHDIGPTIVAAFSRKVGSKTKRASGP